MGNLGDVKGKPDVTRERREDGGRRGGWGEDGGGAGQREKVFFQHSVPAAASPPDQKAVNSVPRLVEGPAQSRNQSRTCSETLGKDPRARR